MFDIPTRGQAGALNHVRRDPCARVQDGAACDVDGLLGLDELGARRGELGIHARLVGAGAELRVDLGGDGAGDGFRAIHSGLSGAYRSGQGMMVETREREARRNVKPDL